MQYLWDVPYTGLALNWILISLEVCVGVLGIDTLCIFSTCTYESRYI